MVNVATKGIRSTGLSGVRMEKIVMKLKNF